MAELGDFLMAARKRMGLSLREVEEKSGVSNAYISMIESGKRTDPHPNILKKLAEVYHIDISELMSMAGYLSIHSQPEDEKAEVERLYLEARSDPAFSYGRRSRGKVDFPTRKLIAKMYKELKEKKG